MYQSLVVIDNGYRIVCYPHCHSTAFPQHGFS